MKSINVILGEAWEAVSAAGLILKSVYFDVDTVDVSSLESDAVKLSHRVKKIETHGISVDSITRDEKPRVVLKTTDDYIKEIEELNSHVDGLRASLKHYEESLKNAKHHNAELEDLLASARCIAQRKGKDTAWNRFDRAIRNLGVSSVTARTYKLFDGGPDV